MVRTTAPLLMAAGCLLILSGCETTGSQRTLGGTGRTQAAREDLANARKYLDHGEVSAAIPILLQAISKYPESPAAIEARFLLGRAYYELSGHRDAIEMFKDYLRLAPDGPYASDAITYVAQLTAEYNERFMTPEALDARIRQLSATLAQDPESVDVQMELAEMLWRRGNYSRAAEIYSALVKQHPRYAQDTTLRQRIELLPNGEYIVLNPAELQRRQVEAQPIQVFNVAGFPAGRDLFTRTRTYYVVTGQVVNRSDSVLYGVQVLVTIYAFGNTVYDTQTVSIGRLNPSETRAFSVRLTNFEYLENINRFETTATFQR
jgi:tetratricopeptide (TPR) repeat protein